MVVITCCFIIVSLCFVVGAGKHLLACRELKQSKLRIAELERALKQRGLLAREVAHELKNPITAILCSADTLELLLRDKVDESYLRCFNYIKDYGESVLRLVSDFIDVSLGEAGHLTSHPKVVVIGQTLKAIAGLLEANALRKNIHLDYVSDEGTRVVADPKHCKQILFNLLHNSIKFTPINGTIKISIERQKVGQRVRIIIEDNGIGMTTQEISNVFDPYGSGRFDAKHPESGVGLGLPLTYRLVKIAGGDMRVESDVGNGTRVIVELPGDDWQPQISSQVPSIAQVQPLIGQSFLVVDPHDGARCSVQALLEALGGAVEAVSTATDAVDALVTHSYSALLVDESLQCDNFTELLHTLKSDTRHRMTRLIVAKSSEDSCEADSKGEIQKPLNSQRLLASLVATH